MQQLQQTKLTPQQSELAQEPKNSLHKEVEGSQNKTTPE
jgi:hypothetical protein